MPEAISTKHPVTKRNRLTSKHEDPFLLNHTEDLFCPHLRDLFQGQKASQNHGSGNKEKDR